MKFGVRQICNVVFKAKAPMTIGSSTFQAGQPVLYIDTATASTLEQATTTVYAQGGRGNTRLVTWEGEKTLTFTVTDALLSPISLTILSGAGLFKSKVETDKVHVHTTAVASCRVSGDNYEINLKDALGEEEYIDTEAPVFVSEIESDGSLTGTLIEGLKGDKEGATDTPGDHKNTKLLKGTIDTNDIVTTKNVFVDFYVLKPSMNISEIQIDAASFGGNFYVEASTLFRNTDGTDLPCEITIPNVKIQSNFTFSMAATGDPSTFDFTMDAMPGYTLFDRSHKVMCVMQVVEDAKAGSATRDSVMKHADMAINENIYDSIESNNQKNADNEQVSKSESGTWGQQPTQPTPPTP